MLSELNTYLMKCSACNMEIQSNSKFCNHCGAKIESQGKICPNEKCQRSGLPPEAVYCPDCGSIINKEPIEISETSVVRKQCKKNKKIYQPLKLILLFVFSASILTLIISHFNFSADAKLDNIEQTNENDRANWGIIRKLKDIKFVSCLSFSPDGKYLACADMENVKIYNCSTGGCLMTLVAGITDVNTVTYSPDGKFVASGSNEFIKVFNSTSGSCLHTIKIQNDNIESLAFTRDGEFLISGSFYGTIKLWNVSSGKLLRTIYNNSENFNNGGSRDVVNSISTSIDGHSFVSGHSNKRIKFWKIGRAHV